MASEYCVVFVTAESENEARTVAAAVLEERLAACVNIVPAVRSLYWWDGKIQDDAEVLCIMKTTMNRFDELVRTVRRAHSYDVPEVVALPVQDGSEPYLKWIDENVK